MGRPPSRRQAETPDFLEQARRLREMQDSEPELLLDLAKKFGVSSRKAYYLVEIDRKFSTLKVDRERLLGIGWTKAQIIAEHADQGNINDLLSKAETHSAKELQTILSDGDSSRAQHCVLFYFNDEEYELLSRVLRKRGALPAPRGLHGKEQALVKALKELE